MIVRITRNEVKRMICSSGFWLSVGLSVLILFTSGVYKEQDGTSYTILTAPFFFRKEQLIRHNLNVQTVFSMTVRYQLPMYGSLLAALSFVGVLGEEQKYKVCRYLIFKEGKKPYVLSKVFSAICTSGLSFGISAMVLLVFLYWKYPLISTDTDSFSLWMEYHAQRIDGTTISLFKWFGEHAFCVLQLIGVILYGVFCGFIGYLCTIFFSNVYLAICIPFFLGYLYYSVMQAIMGRVAEGMIITEVYNNLNSYASPEGYMYFWRMQSSFLVNIAILFVIWGIAIGIHIFRVLYAIDCGGMNK